MQSILRFTLVSMTTGATTGVLYGVLYVLLLRVFGLSRGVVEDTLDEQVRMLEKVRLPFLKLATRITESLLNRIYGRGLEGWLPATTVIGGLLTAVVIGPSWFEYRSVPEGVREAKRQLEREVSPLLYDHVTKRELRPLYDRAMETTWIPTVEAGNIPVPAHDDQLSVDLRRAKYEFQERWLQRSTSASERREFFLLTLFEGTFLSPGFRWIESGLLVAFNLSIDLASVLLLTFAVRIAKQADSTRSHLVGAALVLLVSPMLFALAHFSYRMFLAGNVEIFLQILVFVPLATAVLLLGLAGIAAIVAIMVTERTLLPIVGLVMFAPALAFGGWSIAAAFRLWSQIALGPAMGEPMLLASTTMIPLGLCAAGYATALVVQVTTEALRTMLAAHFEFMQADASASRAAAVITLLGFATGVAAALRGIG